MRNKLSYYELVAIYIQLLDHIYYKKLVAKERESYSQFIRDIHYRDESYKKIFPLSLFTEYDKVLINYPYKINHWKQLLDNHINVWNYTNLPVGISIHYVVNMINLPTSYYPQHYFKFEDLYTLSFPIKYTQSKKWILNVESNNVKSNLTK